MIVLNKLVSVKVPDNFMVVDDDVTSNLICKHTLRRLFKNTPINIFTEPLEALEFFEKKYNETEENNSTVLFLDINMPSMTGWDFLNAFKNFTSDIHNRYKIYMLSSSVDDRDKERAEKNIFVCGFLSKPLTLNTINQIFTFGDTTGQKA